MVCILRKLIRMILMNKLIVVSFCFFVLCKCSSYGGEPTSVETNYVKKSIKIILNAETSRSDTSTYAIGEDVKLKFRVEGCEDNDKVVLNLKITDEFGNVVKKATLPVKGKDIIFSAPASKLGFYRVYATLSNGVTVSAIGSRPSGFISYCVVPDPASRKLYPPEKTRFGMQGGFTDVNILPYLGIRFILGGYHWHYVEPDFSGQYKEKMRDFQVRFVEKNAESWHVGQGKQRHNWKTYRVPSVFNGAPKWAVVPGTKVYASGVLTPSGEKAWAEYCQAVGKDFAQQAKDDSVRFYQITWEPNFPWGYNGTDEQLIKIYEIAYTYLHKVDAAAFVLGANLTGAFTDSGIKQHEVLLKKGLGNFIDGFAVHAYELSPSRDTALQIRRFRAMVKRCAGRDIPVYITEQGFATGEKVENELTQAHVLIWDNLMSLGEGIQFNMNFYITDYKRAQEFGYGFYYNHDPKRGYGPPKSSPKPVAPAYAAMTFLLDGSSPIKPIEWLGDTAMGYAYEKDDGVILALWDFKKERDIEIPVGKKSVTVYDWMGNSRNIDTDNGVLKVKISQQPIYVAGVDEALWGRDSLDLLRVENDLVAIPGEKIDIVGTVFARGKGDIDKKYKLIVSMDGGSTEKQVSKSMLLAHESGDFSIPLEIPDDLALGKYPVTVDLRTSSNTVAFSGTILSVQSPVSILSVKPGISTDQSRTVNIVCENISGQLLKGKLALKIDDILGTEKSLPIELAPGMTHEYTVEYDESFWFDPRSDYSASVSFINSAGQVIETKSFRINWLPVSKVSDGAIKIDGNYSDWDDIPGFLISGKKYILREPQHYSGADDCHASVKMAFNEKYLYLLVKVSDDIFYQDGYGYGSRNGDAVQLGFNLDPYKKKRETGNIFADSFSYLRASRIDLALPHGKPEAYRPDTFDKDKYPIRYLSQNEIAFNIKRNGDHMIIYEVAVPWTTLGVTDGIVPKRIGFALSVSDRDYPTSQQGHTSVLGIFDGIQHPTFKPERFGILLLK